ncbi:NAD-dependent protein deacetylase sirtuin-3, mitochondrial [Solea senegalensis]|uniref:NAD-dependent protein deacetylase sirtuin-3, mitochondrial n=1 Tax=Solea senegalensis TaxID=28829 RepID=A0AAV6Q3L6_SOLSE|nr:NAD-dependent protein deacetylase sirtuin-3, mitochondrial [Solea senegalensis]
MTSLLSSLLISVTSRRLCAHGFGLRRLFAAEGAAASSRPLPRKSDSPWQDGARGLFSRGGGSEVKQMTLEDVAKRIRERQHKRVVVMAGAGISTPSGIPDFRSPGSGLYDNLQQYNLPYAEAIFEIGFFHQNPKPFFTLAKELYPGNYRPNLAHYFVRLLHQKGQLLRMYTQNIDGLERLAGIPPEMLVEAHGTFATATCTVCLRNYKDNDLRADVMSGTVPKCPVCKGVVKPDIVFFGEELPRHFMKYLTDLPLADLLIVMGTSLEVEPFASLAGATAAPGRRAAGRRGQRRAGLGRRPRLDAGAGSSDGCSCGGGSCDKDGGMMSSERADMANKWKTDWTTPVDGRQ